MLTKKDDEGVDFSHYFKRNTNSTPEGTGNNQNKKIRAKKYIAILFSVIALAVAGFFIYKYTRPIQPAANYTPPSGYRMTSGVNEPPKLEKIP